MGEFIFFFFEVYWYEETLNEFNVPNYSGIIPLSQQTPDISKERLPVQLLADMAANASDKFEFPYNHGGDFRLKVANHGFHLYKDRETIDWIFRYINQQGCVRKHIPDYDSNED